MPRWAILSERRRGMGVSPNRISPSSAWLNPVMQLKNVVVPAPVGPITLTMAFFSISKSSALTAKRPPKRLVTRRAVRMGIASPNVLLCCGVRGRRFFFGPGVQLAPDGGGGQQPFRLAQHHRDHGGAVEQETGFREIPEEFWQANQK